MSKAWPLVAVLVAAAVALVLLVRKHDDGAATTAAERAEAERAAGELMGVGRDEAAAPRETAPGAGDAAHPGTPSTSFRRFLAGVVRDEADGSPIPGAALALLAHKDPCLRWPDPVQRLLTAATDAEGRFAFEAAAEDVPEPRTTDLFVRARGHVGTVVCETAHDEALEVRLARGLVMRCRVADPRAQPVVHAAVLAKPGPETPSVPGHYGEAATDEHGDARLDELLAGNVLVEIDHPWFMPQTSGPYDPSRDTDVSFVLTPALRATFKIRSNDGRPVENATIFWRTAGNAPKTELRLLTCQPLETKAEKGSEIECEPVRVPCDAPTVLLEVKADGYAPWRLDGERLPPEGGERTFDVVLSGDASLGSVRVLLEDERGEKVLFAKSRAEVASVTRLDGMPVPSGYVLEAAEDLRFPALPPGPYRVAIRGPQFAPVEVEVTAASGRETEAHATVRPPAKLRVKFVSPQAVVVRFHLSQDGRPVVAVPEGVPTARTDDDSKQPIYSAGEAGLLLSGLATGTYSVEVDSEEVTAPPTSVRLQEGETEEVEIDVRPR